MSPRGLWPVDEELGVGRRNVSIGRLFKHFHLNLPERAAALKPSSAILATSVGSSLWTSRYSGTSSNCKGNPCSNRASGTLPHLRVLCLLVYLAVAQAAWAVKSYNRHPLFFPRNKTDILAHAKWLIQEAFPYHWIFKKIQVLIIVNIFIWNRKYKKTIRNQPQQ